MPASGIAPEYRWTTIGMFAPMLIVAGVCTASAAGEINLALAPVCSVPPTSSSSSPPRSGASPLLVVEPQPIP